MIVKKKKILEVLKRYPSSKEALNELFPTLFIKEHWKKKSNSLFVNTLTKESFRIGDKITIKSPTMRFGDNVREHKIRCFSYEENETGLYEKVWAHFEGYAMERSLRLDDIINMSR